MIPTIEYAERRKAQIKAACDSNNGDLLASLIDLTAAEGYREFADRLIAELLASGVASVSAGQGT